MKLALQAAVVVMAGTGLMANGATAQIYKGETAGAGGPPHTMFVTFAKHAADAGVNIQVNAGKTLTKSMLTAGRGKLAFYSGVPGLVALMSGGKKMYKKTKDAPDAAKNLRAILGFKAGAYHPVTLAGSGIEDWKDIKGKTVFTGPPSGAAAATSELVIKLITGYAPNKDYKAVRLSWGEGIAALRDKKIDMMMRPADIGSALIQQFGLSGKFRVLTIPDAVVQSDGMKKLFGRPGRGLAAFDGSLYKGQQTKGKINALGFFQFVGTHKGVADDVVYKATKAFWENLDKVHAAAHFLKEVSKETAFIAVNAPLHPGAVRYYKEAGFKIPQNLMPN
ncbi:MAG: TAXI family TRAP transporter solute-binding subunit [Hyphomicrobiaceae bacterium]